MPKIWRLKPPQPKLQAELSSALHIHPIVAQILINRGVLTQEAAASFLSPQLDDLFDPFLLKGMDKAVARVRLAKANNEKVMIYGDYDVDGVTSVAVLWRALKKFGIDAIKYIPHRMEEGYGLNLEIIPLAKELGVTLLMTVDCGVTSCEEVKALQKEGIDAVITDHHEPEEDRLPDAVSIIDAKQPGCTYPFRDLAGVGIAAKFAHALLGEFPKEDLDLITLGTIADVVPLRGENRIIVRFGLPMIMKTKKRGLKALIQSARIEGKEASPYLVGFILGPRLNAAGRMGTANTSLDLLLSEDATSSAALASSLEAHNRDRQRLQGVVFDEAIAQIDSDQALFKRDVIVAHGEGWHKGVLGIAASKIAERYGKPAIVISFSEGFGVGSARSVEGFHLNEALAHCSGILDEFGGHKRAAGLKLKHERVAEFREKINDFAKGIFQQEPVPTLEIDTELPLTQVSMELVKTVASLEPHGEGNPAPLFATRRLMVKSRPQVLGKDTIKFWVTDGRVSLSVVGFGMGTGCADLRMGQAVDIVYTLGIDDWNKAPQVQLVLKDIRSIIK
ncbi:MAG: single-stranded-DNA-specific exonuclease RecJ [Candidatus Omnitrophica bacterium]|nr:single-stranded-DNA-specific exonuclease RecJ [Candidatus Omnitrophota bacterium]